MNKDSQVAPSTQTQSRSSLIAHKEPYSSCEGSIDYSLDDLPDDIRDLQPADSAADSVSSHSSGDNRDESDVFSDQHRTAEVEVHKSAELSTDQSQELLQSHDLPFDQSAPPVVSADLPVDQSPPVRAMLRVCSADVPLLLWRDYTLLIGHGLQ